MRMLVSVELKLQSIISFLGFHITKLVWRDREAMDGGNPGIIGVDIVVKIFNKLHESHKRRADLPGRIDFIKKELRSINEAMGKADREGIRSWMADLRDIRLKIDNCVDLYNLRVAGCEHEQGTLCYRIHHMKTTFARGKLADDIDAITKLVREARERVNTYHPQHAAAAAQNHDHGSNGVAAHPNEAHPEGLDGPKAELVRLLAKGDGKASQLRVIVIDGFGGSGKSLLATLSYEQVSRDEEIKCKASVSASDNADDLLRDILREFNVDIPPSSKLTYLEGRFKEIVADKRYVIVIKGVQKSAVLGHLLSICPDNGMSSRIIFTTRNGRIARNYCQNCMVQKMQPLDQPSARALLRRKASDAHGQCRVTSVQHLDLILNACECLPLAIINMANHIKGEREWNANDCVQACHTIGSLLHRTDIEAFSRMNRVLNRSYDSLKNETTNWQDCLLSLTTTYRKDDIFKTKSVVRRWLAEELIMETEVKECFQDLLNHNIIVPTDVSLNGKVKRFRVRRVMLEFMMERARSEDYATWIHMHDGGGMGKGHARSVRRLVLYNESTTPHKIGTSVDLVGVRSLTFSGQASKALMNLAGYTLLRVLDLEDCSNLQDENLETVCKSSLLVYLSIRGNAGVTKIPRKIAKLRHLVTLDTRGTSVATLPVEVIHLPKLSNLFGQFQINSCPSNKSSTCNLHTLAGFFIDESPSFVKALPLMPKLSKVKILRRRKAAPGAGSQVVNDLVQSLQKCLSLPNLLLRSLSIDFGDSGNLDFLNKVEVPVPCPLQSLKLRGKLAALPKLVMESKNLENLCLSETSLGCDALPQLQWSLPELVNLKLAEAEDASTFGAQGFVWPSGAFCNLKRLCFAVPEMPKLVIEREVRGLESLQLLCSSRLGAIDGIEHLLRLEEVVVFRGVEGLQHLRRQVEAHPMRSKFVEKPHPNDFVFNNALSTNVLNVPYRVTCFLEQWMKLAPIKRAVEVSNCRDLLRVQMRKLAGDALENGRSIG
ncbi:hypothetical protein GUJ93_ZPchr0011g27957 [Zizania palustris]|uniref:Rx N-terminal domain-containing protein n=1 Tax=Zizania palustris TaxID=103762 RepID=A0A8J6BMP8_ZIZPA|nr:hypothetical protein GUJ93_ZPchr0011g27957 [Zizania palustris]